MIVQNKYFIDISPDTVEAHVSIIHLRFSRLIIIIIVIIITVTITITIIVILINVTIIIIIIVILIIKAWSSHKWNLLDIASVDDHHHSDHHHCDCDHHHHYRDDLHQFIVSS